MRRRRFGAHAAVAASFIAATCVMTRPAAADVSGVEQLSARQACRAALAREESGKPMNFSRTPCDKAFLSGMPEDMRNDVASMMSPAAHPSLDDLAIATLMADATVRKAHDQPWGYLARCDIGRRLGNADLLASCVEDIRRVAPQSDALKQALRMAAERPSAAVRLFRLLLALGLFATLAHAGRAAWLARFRRRGAAPASLVAFLAIFAGLSGWGSRAASAQTPLPGGQDHLSDFKINDEDPESSVPGPEAATRDPLQFGYFLQDLAARAEAAVKQGDHAAAARYYGAIAKGAPTVAYPPRQMCVELEAAGDMERAIQACRSAVARLGSTAADYTRFVALVLASKGPLPAGERKELDAVIAHLQKEAQLGAVPTMLRCEVDLRFKDLPAFEACTAELAKLAPDDPKTVSLQWALAVEKHDRGTAMSLLERARGLGVNAAALAKMEEGTRAILRRRAQRVGLLIIAAAFVAAGLVFGRRWLGTRRQPAV
jgi:hypothetical protein